MSKGKIKKVAGPLVIAEGMRDANMYDWDESGFLRAFFRIIRRQMSDSAMTR